MKNCAGIVVVIPQCPNGYDRATTYVDTLLKEIDQTAPLIATEHGNVSHLHFGGGTPTYLNGKDIGRIVDKVEEKMGLRAGGEVAIEIDPRTFSSPARPRACRHGL